MSGLDASAILPQTMTFHRKIIFKGFLGVGTVKIQLKYKKGERVSFVDATDTGNTLVINISLKHSDSIS
jgi:hypothetical protein